LSTRWEILSIFAISDLHLSFSIDKPMNIFGNNWDNHAEKIKKDWQEKVKENDLVLLPGDFSWATYIKDTYKDFEYLNSLPGKKLLLKGNHDYWWTTLTSMREYLKQNNFETIDFIYNNSYIYENHIIVGTRGWNMDNKEESKIYKRELLRLELSLEDGIKKYGKDLPIIVCTHYPPIIDKNDTKTEMIEIMKKYNVKTCLYGHLHGISQDEIIQGNIEGIDIKMVSADYLNFKILKIA